MKKINKLASAFCKENWFWKSISKCMRPEGGMMFIKAGPGGGDGGDKWIVIFLELCSELILALILIPPWS